MRPRGPHPASENAIPGIRMAPVCHNLNPRAWSSMAAG